MMMRPLQNKGKNKIAITFALIILFLLVFGGHLPQFALKPIMFVANPFLKIGQKLDIWYKQNIVIIKNKKFLEEENSRLKERNFQLESELLSCKNLKQENEQIKSLLGRIDKRNFILTGVISRPPQSPYDILIIDIGSNNGVEKGMPVSAYSDILLGYIADVFPESSKVKLLSFSRDEINVMVQSAESGEQISAIAIGKGGGNLEIRLPNSIKIKPGDRIVTTGVFSYVAGVAEKIESEPTEQFQKILFRLPLNIQELRFVTVEK